jgi:hypothetical protein
LGYKHPESFGKGISKRSKGHSVFQETRNKIGLANRGRKHTAEAVAKIQKASIGRIKPIKTYQGFISPEGIIYRDIEDLKRFCIKLDLNYANMNQVDNGHKRQHKGWRKLDASTNQTSGS